MTDKKKYVSLLEMFEIPLRSEKEAEQVRGILARLLAAHSVRLAHLQTSRDIMELAEVKDPLAYLFLAAMFMSESAGNAFMKDDAVVGLIAAGGHLDDPKSCGFVKAADEAESNEDFEASVKSICSGIGNADWKENLSGDIVVKDGVRWFFQRNFAAVKELNDSFKVLASAKKLGDVADDVLSKAAAFNGFSLNDMQREALAAAVTRRFTVITGGPGTGKTTTVCAILRAFLSLNPDLTADDIALVAPTGRAGQRMKEAILSQCAGLSGEPICGLSESLEGTTVHRLLGGYAPNWKHDEKDPLDKKVVIVDETSMMDIYLMQGLFKALNNDARLIMLGDADQLPSVGTGAVLGDLTNLGVDADVVKRLEVCERAKGEISDVAKSVNECADSDEAAKSVIENWKKIDVTALPCTGEVESGKSEFRWFEPNDGVRKADVLGFYDKWMSDGKLADLAAEIRLTDSCFIGVMTDSAKALFAELNRLRILTLVREGWYGADGVNAHLFKAAALKAGKSHATCLSLVGVPVMVTRNEAERGLFNGDVGVTVRGPNGMVVLFPRGKETIACPVALLPEHELAYAMTVHKSQGSEFENVMVVLPADKAHPLLTRQVVYTGITRARKRVVVIGSAEVLQSAISRKTERDTGICVKE